MTSPIYFSNTFNPQFFTKATRTAFTPNTISELTVTSEQILSDFGQHIVEINRYIIDQQKQIDYLKSKNDRMIDFIKLHHNVDI